MQVVDTLGGWATIAGAARVAKVTYWVVDRYIRTGRLHAIKLGGKTTLVRISDIKRLVKDAE